MIDDNTSAKLSAIEESIDNEPVINAAIPLMIVSKKAVDTLAPAATNLYCDSLILLFDNFKKHLHFIRVNHCHFIT